MTSKKLKRGFYKKNLNSEVTALMLIGGVLFLVYEFMRKERNMLDKDIIEAVVNNYAFGVLK